MTSSGSGFRSLADQLRGWDDEQLALLVRRRIDLATPAPADLGQLASRACARASVQYAQSGLSLVELVTLDAAGVLGAASAGRLVEVVHAPTDSVTDAVATLRELALLWESPAGLRPVSVVAETLRGGLDRGCSGLQSFSSEPTDATTISAGIAALSKQARALLAHVVDAGGEATSGEARLTITPDEARSPAEELTSRRLLVPRGDRLVVPGEVALAVRGGHTTTDPLPTLPALSTALRGATLTDRAAAGAAEEFARSVAHAVEWFDRRHPTQLRGGGLGVRDLKALGDELGTEPTSTALIVEVAFGAGLVGAVTESAGDAVWAPTTTFDRWLATGSAERWVPLVRCWLDLPRDASIVGTKDDAGKTRNALGPDPSRPGIERIRRLVVEHLLSIDPGESLPVDGAAAVLARLHWLRPRDPGISESVVGQTLDEAAHVGLTGLGSPAPFLATTLDADVGDAELARVVARSLPEPVEQVVIQADLTAVAPGPLTPERERELSAVADVESRGAATTYRFTQRSVQRALSTGRTAEEIAAFIAEVSATPVPQPLTYLIEDAARTHGRTRVGYAEAFVRSDDEAALAELLAHPDAAGLSLRRIAPTVVIAGAPADEVAELLGKVGLSPVVETLDGGVAVASGSGLRARGPRAVRSGEDPVDVEPIVAAMRAGEKAAQTHRSDAGGTPTSVMASLREAVETSVEVVIDYVDGDGRSTRRAVVPQAVEDGTLRGFDTRTKSPRTFAIHRITSVS